MEKCADSDFMLPEHDASQNPRIDTCTHDSCLSDKTEEKNKCKNSCEVSRVHQKIASEDWSSGRPDPTENVTKKRTRRHQSGAKLNVLNKHVTETARQSVQKKTKIIKSNVPDRLGKFVSNRVRSETKILLNECKLKTKSSSGEKPSQELYKTSEVVEANDGNTETKIAVLGNECLSNEEADRLRNCFESDLETKNIFEKFFDDCLDSTRNGIDASSQETVDKDKGKEINQKSLEKTPEKQKRETTSIGAPVKIKDHSNYFSSHKNIRHVCAYCHKIFKSNGKLNSHVFSHTGERPFDCNNCGKAFSSKFKLVRHLLIHSEVRKFVCQICDRTFLRNDHLKNHYKIHDPQKKMYKCPKENCDKEYSSIMSHKKHMAYHNVEDGDLKCLICNVKYETKEEILFHLKSHSGSRLFKTQSDKKFKCQFCERLFLTRKDVTRHLVVHTGERDFLCQFCPQRFGRKDHLVRHIKKSHRNEDLVKGVEVKTTKEEPKKVDELKIIEKPNPEPQSVIPSKENSTQLDEDKPRIVITLQETPSKIRNKSKLQKKPFQKNESLVPKKKQVPLAKGKSQTTQILLQNIPNILIIPNNSIILLRNQTFTRRTLEASQSVNPEQSAPPTLEMNENLILSSQPPSTDFNFTYDSTIFPSASQMFEGFHEPDNFCNFQPELPPFGTQFESDFALINQTDLLPRTEVTLGSDTQANGSLLLETSTPAKTDMNKDLFPNEMLNNSMLTESSVVLPTDNNVGILENILTQPNENCGFELLRHLLTSDNPVLAPLPGFSQIFHNSNANSN